MPPDEKEEPEFEVEIEVVVRARRKADNRIHGESVGKRVYVNGYADRAQRTAFADGISSAALTIVSEYKTYFGLG